MSNVRGRKVDYLGLESEVQASGFNGAPCKKHTCKRSPTRKWLNDQVVRKVESSLWIHCDGEKIVKCPRSKQKNNKKITKQKNKLFNAPILYILFSLLWIKSHRRSFSLAARSCNLYIVIGQEKRVGINNSRTAEGVLAILSILRRSFECA